MATVGCCRPPSHLWHHHHHLHSPHLPLKQIKTYSKQMLKHQQLIFLIEFCLIGLLPFVWSPALRHWRLSSYLWSFASKYLDLNSIVQILEVGLYSHTVIHSIIVYSPFGADCEPVEIPSNRAARLRLCCRRTWRILAVPKVFFLCFSMETNWIQLIIMAKFWEILCGDVFFWGAFDMILILSCVRCFMTCFTPDEFFVGSWTSTWNPH